MPYKLDVTTPSDREIRLTRKFDAPAALVFECHTKPELVKQWLLGPDGWSMPVCEVDLRVGGGYRYLWHNDTDGREFGVQGEFREVTPNRIVNVETMDGVPGQTLCTTTFEKSGEGTLLTLTIAFESQELRDGALETGMSDGLGMSYDRLDDVAAKKEARL